MKIDSSLRMQNRQSISLLKSQSPATFAVKAEERVGYMSLTFLSILPVPVIVCLYVFDGLIVPPMILGEYSCMAFIAAGLVGLFLCTAAYEIKESRKAFLLISLIGNMGCLITAFVFMFFPVLPHGDHFKRKTQASFYSDDSDI